MHGPPLVGWLLVALCAATGTWCLLRMRACRAPAERRTAAAEALMGIGMAAMAVPVTVLDTGVAGAAVFAVVFTAAGLHALLLARHDRHHVHHAVGAAAMVYMAVVMAQGPAGPAGHAAHAAHAAGQPGTASSGLPLVSGLLLVYFTGHALWCVTRSVPAGAAAGAAGPPVLPAEAWTAGAGTAKAGAGGGRLLSAPEVTAACRASMGICMVAMLLLM